MSNLSLKSSKMTKSGSMTNLHRNDSNKDLYSNLNDINELMIKDFLTQVFDPNQSNQDIKINKEEITKLNGLPQR